MNTFVKSKKSLLCLVMVVLVVASVFAITALSASAASSEGASFSETVVYKLERPVPTHTSFTFESEFWIDPNSADSTRAYSLIGNYSNTADDRNVEPNGVWGVELHKYGEVRLFHQTQGSVYFHGGADTRNDISHTNNKAYLTEIKNQYYNQGIKPDFDIRGYTGTADEPSYVKIAITVDTSEATATLFINGNKIVTVKDEKVLKDREYIGNPKLPPVIGGDHRAANYFKGKIKSITMYDYVREEDAIKNNFADTTDNDLLVAYDLTNIKNGALIDLSKNSIDAHSAASTYKGGRTFATTDTLYVQKKLDKMAKTYEAFVYIPEDDRTGVILGNYGGSSCINFEIHSSRKPSIYITDGSGATMSTKFDYSLEPNAWTHIVVTHDLSFGGSVFTCYINGTQVATFSKELSYSFVGDVTEDNYLMLGGDCRSGNVQNFKGNIKNVAVYSEVLTASQIKSLYNSGIDLNNESLMFCYNLTTPENQTGKTIPDASGNGYDIGPDNCNAFFERTEAIKDYDYSFAIVGDTQKLVYNDAYHGTNYASYIYKWIAANKELKNIQFVMGLGDITDKNGTDQTTADKETDDGIDQTDIEWDIAVDILKELENVNLPYSLVQGNHDTVAKLDKYFANNKNFTDADIIYYSGTSLGNYAIRFEAEGKDHSKTKYMVIVLEYGAKDEILAWAGEVLDANKDYKAIITTHAYMYRDGTTLDFNDTVPPNDPNKETDDYRNNGDMMWEELVSRHENVVMVLSGHDPCANVVMRQDIGVHGNTVSQFLIDFQSMDTKLNFETGMVAMFYVSKNGNVQVEYISTYKTAEALNENPNANDVLYKDRNSFTFNMNSYPKELITDYGIIPYEYRNVDDYPFVLFDENGNLLGTESTLLDRVKEYNNDGAIHIAKNHLSTNKWENGSFGSAEKKAYIVLRKDYVMASNENYNNMAQIRGSLTIDLNGFTITASQGKAMFTSTIKPWSGRIDPTIINLVNGNIKIVDYSVIKFDAWDVTDSSTGVTTYVDNKIFSYNFENITFEVSNNVSSPLVTYAQHGTTKTAIGNPDMSFVNCTFDLTNAKEGVTLFDLGNGYIDTKITLIGGEIILGKNNVVLAVQNDISGGTATLNGSLTFDKAECGNYMSITLPVGVALPELNANGGTLTLVKISETADSIVYRLRPTATTGISFTPKMSITLGNDFVMNVYVPANKALQNIVFNGETYTVSDLDAGEKETIDGDVYYVLTVGLPAAEAIKNVTLKATIAVTEENSATATFTFSIPKYATKVIANGNDTEVTLVKDVLAYVKSAYAYFNANGLVTDEALAEANATINAILGDYNGEFSKVDGETSHGTGITDVTLVLGANPAIRFYGEASQNYTYKYNNTVLESVYNETDKYTDVYLYAYQMIGTVTYTDGTNSGSYHINTYYDGVNKTDTALVDLVEKLYNYCKSAEAYRASVTK